MNGEDRELGMGRKISRRDFVQGVAVAAVGGAGLGGSASAALAQATLAAPGPARYPPLRTGMRGAHPGSFETAHAMRDGETFAGADSTGEVYDLVVVGCGLSGLAAAYLYRKNAGPNARILILDNHDDFGGHAKRNEFVHNGRTYLANGGSAYLTSPKDWTREAISIVEEMGIDWRKPPALARGLQTSLPLGPATYFNKSYYGKDRLVLGGTPENPTPEFLARTPLSPPLQGEVLRLYTGTTDYMAGLSVEEKYAKLRTMSYRDYLLDVAKFSPELLNYTRGVWCLGNDMCSAWFAFYRERPGFLGLGLGEPGHEDQGNYTWPCGNSELARLMVRSLIPEALAAGSWVEVGDKRVDYAVLDRSSAPTRIRLSSIVVSARHLGVHHQLDHDSREVEVAYLSGDRLKSVRGKDVIMACNNNIIPYLCPDMPEQQKGALHQAVRAVNQQTNVLFRNWEAFAKLKVNRLSCPNSFYGGMSMNTPGLLGGQQPIRSPSEAVVVSFSTGINSGILNNTAMVRELCGGSPPSPGTPMDDQFRAVRAGLLATPFESFERTIRQMSAGALSGGGFDPARDILAITVNRWPHGFAIGRNSLFDTNLDEVSPTILARQKFGRIAICNSDASGMGTASTALYEASRAVSDLQTLGTGLYETF